MMDAINESGIHTVVIMSSAQVGKSEIMLNAIGYYMDQDPAPMLMLQPTLEMAEAFSKDRVAPMMRDTPALSGVVKDPRAKDSANTLLHKKFAGGHLTLCGANSPASLASRPVRIVLGDEVDRYPISAGTEGDPLQLAMKRTTTFHNRKAIIASTPTVKDASRIEMAYQASDQRRFYVPCPHCGIMQPLDWDHMRFGKTEEGGWDGSPSHYECDGCGQAITEGHKAGMLKAGRWVAEGVMCGTAGFHINELYSPWRRWDEVVHDWNEARKDTELERVFINTSLGLTFEETGEGVDGTGLFARREKYASEVPAEVACLVAGVDTQDDRLEVSVVGLGAKGEKWLIEHRIIHGDPGGAKVWQALDEVIIEGEYKHEGGSSLRVAATCIDSGGHHTKAVYAYCRSKKGRRIFPIKGVAGFGRPSVGAPSKRRFGRDRVTVDLWPIGVDELKTTVYRRLAVKYPGSGYVHFPEKDDFGEEYFNQLGSEKMVTRFRKGVPYREWIQIRRRNEALDCLVYAFAAEILLNPRIEVLARRIKKDAKDQDPEDKPGPVAKKRGPVRRRPGFVNGWK